MGLQLVHHHLQQGALGERRAVAIQQGHHTGLKAGHGQAFETQLVGAHGEVAGFITQGKFHLQRALVAGAQRRAGHVHHHLCTQAVECGQQAQLGRLHVHVQHARHRVAQRKTLSHGPLQLGLGDFVARQRRCVVLRFGGRIARGSPRQPAQGQAQGKGKESSAAHGEIVKGVQGAAPWTIQP